MEQHPRRKGKGSVVVKGTDGAGNSSALPASWHREHVANNEGDCLVRLQSEQEHKGQPPPEQELTARQGRTSTTGQFTDLGREGCRCFAASHRQGKLGIASKPIAWEEGKKTDKIHQATRPRLVLVQSEEKLWNG